MLKMDIPVAIIYKLLVSEDYPINFDSLVPLIQMGMGEGSKDQEFPLEIMPVVNYMTGVVSVDNI